MIVSTLASNIELQRQQQEEVLCVAEEVICCCPGLVMALLWLQPKPLLDQASGSGRAGLQLVLQQQSEQNRVLGQHHLP